MTPSLASIRRDLIVAFGAAFGLTFTVGWQIIEKVEFFKVAKMSNYGLRGLGKLWITGRIHATIPL
jgi:hypothetical protein